MNNANLAVAPNNNEAATSHSNVMLSMIDRVCTSPDFDISKMEKLIEMRNAELDRAAKIDFNRAFAEMQSELPQVATKHKNQQTHSKYAKIENINETVLPILNQYGFSVSFLIPSQDGNGVTVRAVLAHAEGHRESTDLFMPYDRTGAQGKVNKTDIHAIGSTITYAKRYAMCMLLNISTGDDNDGNNNMSQFITTEQAEEIHRLLECTNSNKIKFISDYMKVTMITKILAKDYKKAINALEVKKRNSNEKS